jgi:hypothetical protein
MEPRHKETIRVKSLIEDKGEVAKYGERILITQLQCTVTHI